MIGIKLEDLDSKKECLNIGLENSSIIEIKVKNPKDKGRTTIIKIDAEEFIQASELIKLSRNFLIKRELNDATGNHSSD